MTRLSRRRTAAALALPALTVPLLTACASLGTSASAGPAAAGHGSAAGAGAGTAASTTIDGRRITVPGRKPVALVFLSIGCADCASAAASAVGTHGTEATGGDCY